MKERKHSGQGTEKVRTPKGKGKKYGEKDLMSRVGGGQGLFLDTLGGRG